jgi:hypothetical protein
MAVNPMMEGARVNGLNSAIKGMNQAAQDVTELNVDREAVASSGDDRARMPELSDAPGDVNDRAEALVSLKLYQRQTQAAANVAITADAVLGFLLDVHA